MERTCSEKLFVQKIFTINKHVEYINTAVSYSMGVTDLSHRCLVVDLGGGGEGLIAGCGFAGAGGGR